MTRLNKFIPLEYNTNFFIEKSSLFHIEMSFLKYFIIITSLILFAIYSIFYISLLNSKNNLSEEKIFDMQIGVKVNENEENEFYKIVDGENQQLSEEDIKNLEEAQKKTTNIDSYIELDGYEQGSTNLILSN
tara:strand:+ start:935 stop:1330 length:396 start_codon:yes stop_codon:yes gene_type:complete